MASWPTQKPRTRRAGVCCRRIGHGKHLGQRFTTNSLFLRRSTPVRISGKQASESDLDSKSLIGRFILDCELLALLHGKAKSFRVLPSMEKLEGAPGIKFESMHAYIRTCMHTCINLYRHTCIDAYMQAYIHTCMHTYIQTELHYRQTHTHTYLHTYTNIHTCVHTKSICINTSRKPR